MEVKFSTPSTLSLVYILIQGQNGTSNLMLQNIHRQRKFIVYSHSKQEVTVSQWLDVRIGIVTRSNPGKVNGKIPFVKASTRISLRLPIIDITTCDQIFHFLHLNYENNILQCLLSKIIKREITIMTFINGRIITINQYFSFSTFSIKILNINLYWFQLRSRLINVLSCSNCRLNML